jgi:hypothetical protein
MNLDQDIRTMLRARADGVAAAPTIPHSTLRRVRVRKTLMTSSIAAVVAALVFGGFAASRSLSSDAAPIPPAQETDFPNLTTTFVSPRNGFSIKLPERVALTPAKQLWGFSKRVEDGFDVAETGLAAVFMGASTNQGGIGLDFGCAGCSTDELVDEFLSDDRPDPNERSLLPGSCGVPRSQQAEITIDGQSGRISECENRIEATVVVDGRLYLFTLLHDRSDARDVFDAFADTIDLTPETAVDVGAMTTTFVSPTNGFSFKYFDRGGLFPATELWDPANQPPIAEEELNGFGAPHWDAFDVVETGLGAVLQAASTEIPDGVSVDEWVDDSVAKYLPAGCYVPRSQQAEITIDGQPGRILEDPDCPATATVVVDGRLYLFIALGERGWFDAWVDTIDLTPESAAVP